MIVFPYPIDLILKSQNAPGVLFDLSQTLNMIKEELSQSESEYSTLPQHSGICEIGLLKYVYCSYQTMTAVATDQMNRLYICSFLGLILLKEIN